MAERMKVVDIAGDGALEYDPSSFCANAMLFFVEIGADDEQEGLMFSFFCCHGRSSAWLAWLLLMLFFNLLQRARYKRIWQSIPPPGTLLFARLFPGEVSQPKFRDILLVEL